MKTITTFFLVFCTLLLSPLSFSQNVYLSDQVTVYPKPVRLPKYSDVIMRSLRFHTYEGDMNTFTAMDQFHVTRLEWTYVKDSIDWPYINQTLSSGRHFGGAGGGYLDYDAPQNWAVQDLSGNAFILPGQSQYIGCENNPLFRDQQIKEYKAYLYHGALSIQRDNAEANGAMVDFGGCFCNYCMTGFSTYLATHATAAELVTYNITNPARFNYKNYLISVNAPVGSAFKTYNGGRMKELFQSFQDQSTYDSYIDQRTRLNNYSKYTFNRDTVPMSMNNSSFQNWGDAFPFTKAFDWGYSEMITSTATPTNFYTKSNMARSLGKMQVYSIAKLMGTQVLDNDYRVRLNRKSIATAYATGGNMSVPWDVYESIGNRYYGQAAEYSDLYGFIRGAANYLEGYEDVAAAGKGIPVKTINGEKVLTVFGDSVFAFARVKPNNHTSPIVIHLVNWKDAINTATVSINLKYLFGGQNYTCKLLKPLAYNATKHNQAEAAAQRLRPAGQLFGPAQSSAYSGLVKTITPNFSISANALTIDVDTLDRWNIIVLTPGTPTPPPNPNLTPVVPVLNAATEITTTSFKASWPAVPGAVSYQVDIAADNSFNNILASYSNLSVFGTYLYGRGLTTFTNYYFRVRAVDYKGIATANSATVSVTTLPIADMIVDGDFSATAMGNFSPLTLTINTTRGVWGGLNNTTDTQPVAVGVTTGGVTGNCAFFTPGTTTPSCYGIFLYQRLPNPTTLITTKPFSLSFSLRADNPNVKAYAYIKSRPTTKFAVRADWKAGNNFSWCFFNNNVPTSWTNYSQSFLFSQQVTGATASIAPVATAFTETELSDMLVGFYSIGGKIYIDNVKLMEDTSSGALTPVVNVYDNQLSTHNADFLLVSGNRVSIPHFTGEPISVYNIAGQLVLKTNKQVFDLERSGLYIVRMGNKVQRIFIK